MRGSLSKGNASSFGLSVYVEAAGMMLMEEKSGHAERFFGLLKQLGVGKVYLETYRGLEGLSRQHSRLIEPPVAERWRDRFVAEGLRVAGGMCIGTWAGGFGAVARDKNNRATSVNCYSNPDTTTFYRKVFREAGQLFDEVLVDDWLFNDCFCDTCIESFVASYGRSVRRCDIRQAYTDEDGELYVAWGRHAAKLLADFSADMITTYKQQRPGGTVRWKLPEWISRFRSHGIHLDLHYDLWDGFLIGSEAREGVEPYAGAYAYHYLQAQFAEKAQGVWFDILSGFDWGSPTSVRRFVDQMKMSVLSGAPEIVIWCYPEIDLPDRVRHMKTLTRTLPELRSLGQSCHGFRGVPTVQQFGACKASSPEASIFDHLGTIGVSVAQQKSVSQADCGQLITEHSDVSGLRQWVEAGGRAIVISGGVRRLIEAGLADLAGLDPAKPVAEELAFITFVELEDGQLHSNCRGHEHPSLHY